MNVLYTLRRNYYPYLLWSVRSLLEHNKLTKLYIFAEDDELPYEIPCKHEIINMTGQQFLKPDSPNVDSYFTWMSSMRFCSPEIIKANKLIYIDVDTIICDSLKPLWETDLTGKWIGAVREHAGTWKPYGKQYFNDGVMVMNLAQMRKDKATDQIMGEMNSTYFRFVEQDVINKIAVSAGKVAEVDLRFNETFCTGYTNNPAIVHFAGRTDWYQNRNMFRWEYRDKYVTR